MPQRSRRGVGRTELTIGGVVVAVLALIAIPLMMSMGKQSKRDEVLRNVESIRTVQIAHKEAFEEYIPADSAPRAPGEVNAETVPWKPTKGFVKLSWAPEEEMVRGSYEVITTKTGFTVKGTCDIDGDGKKAVFKATESQAAMLVTEEGVY